MNNIESIPVAPETFYVRSNEVDHTNTVMHAHHGAVFTFALTFDGRLVRGPGEAGGNWSTVVAQTGPERAETPEGGWEVFEPDQTREGYIIAIAAMLNTTRRTDAERKAAREAL